MRSRRSSRSTSPVVLWREIFEAETELEPLTNPEITNLEFSDDGGFRFTAEFEVRPKYELPEIGGLDLPAVSLEVSDAEIDEELAKVADEQAVWEPAEEAEAADGMLIEVDLEGRVEDSDEEPYTESRRQLRARIGKGAAGDQRGASGRQGR